MMILISRRRYYIGPHVKFGSVSVGLSGSVRLSEQNHVESRLALSINGSGDINLAYLSLTSINAVINGSGDIRGGDTCVEKADLRVNGSGNIKGFFVTSDATGMICGSGDISCNVGVNCSVGTSIYGSGRIKFSK